MIGQLLGGIIDVFTLPAFVAAVVGGIAVGLAMEAVSPARQWRGLAIVTLGLGTLAVAVFWSGQIVDAILGGDPNWGRAAGRAVLQWLFVIAASASAAAMRRHDPPPL